MGHYGVGMERSRRQGTSALMGVRRRTRVVLLIAAVAGLETVWDSLTFPSALARHPVNATATVVDTFINGLGGDPAVDYSYTVNGRSYKGWGERVPGHLDIMSVKPGTPIPIEYAQAKPTDSCTCNAAQHIHTASGVAEGTVAMVPFPALVLGLAHRRRRHAARDADRPPGLVPPPTA
jgi:hypothetical protein